MTYRQIGAEDGVSANTVKVRIQQALKLIEQRFSRYFGVLTIFMILV
jgi:DNA-directed RNA polymerase specialized sigma24 family protein